MNFIKKYFKLFIGIVGLVIVIVVFFCAQRKTNLESGTLKNWLSASHDNKSAVVKILTASELNTELLVQCVDKMASLPDSSEFTIADAVRLCNIGIQLKENN